MRRAGTRHINLLLLGVLLLAGCATGPVPEAPEIAARAAALSPREAANLRVFERAWDLVNRKFHDPKFRGVDWPAAAVTYGPKALAAANDEQLYGVINTMLAGLKESHNWASLPGQSAEDPERPRARLGFSLARQENCWVVMAVQPGGPAAAAGVQPGWLFVTRNGQPLGVNANFKLQEGEIVTDEFLDRQDRTHLLKMTARLLPPAETREARELEGGVWYLRFDKFDIESRRWLSDQLKAHRTAPAVILDVRQNPGGGSLSLGITIGEFFPHSVDWGRFIGRSGWEHEEDSWQWGSARYAGRVVLLVGQGTASSAEIFAHALQFHHRAVLVGRPTAGAVIGSRFYRLPGGGKLQLGVFDYQGLDGRRLEGVGVKPEVVVSLKLADLRAGVDPDLAAALGALRNPAPAAKSE
ncbi:MAG TPA: S41 family peptidase [Opitutaceae bacterium]|nr:S41 family peptidase [Opitutaceae bacterium]